MEHPFDGSWGYQTTACDYQPLWDALSLWRLWTVVIRKESGDLDWVPGHFCQDDHGLRMFDGTACYEYADLRGRITTAGNEQL